MSWLCVVVCVLVFACVCFVCVLFASCCEMVCCLFVCVCLRVSACVCDFVCLFVIYGVMLYVLSLFHFAVRCVFVCVIFFSMKM